MPENITAKLLNPRLDLNFKRVFGNAPKLLAALINAVYWNRPPITVESIRNPEIAPNDLGKKLIVLDVLVRDADGRLLNIELQTRPHMGLPERFVFYLARVLVNEFEAKEDYRRVPPVEGIALLDFNVFPIHEQAVWTFKLRDEQRPEVVLDRPLTLHMLEMPKAERLAQDAPSQIPQALADWLLWFRHSDEENIMQQIQTPEVHQAHQRLRTLSGDAQAWADAAQRESALMMEATLLAQAEEEKVKAEARGRVEGQMSLLLGLLHAKFGEELPVPVKDRLLVAEPSQLEHWAKRVLTAETLEQVFSAH